MGMVGLDARIEQILAVTAKTGWRIGWKEKVTTQFTIQMPQSQRSRTAAVRAQFVAVVRVVGSVHGGTRNLNRLLRVAQDLAVPVQCVRHCGPFPDVVSHRAMPQIPRAIDPTLQPK
jgi:hypothetical protein